MKHTSLWVLCLGLAAASCNTVTDTPALPTVAPTLAEPTDVPATPAAAPTNTLEPAIEATAFAAAVLSAPPELVETSAAPDGKASAELWTAACGVVPGFEAYGPVGHDEIRWRATSDAEPILIAQQIRVCQGLGAFGLRVLQWSADSRYVFYTDAAQGSPDGGGCPWFGRVLRWDTVERAAVSLGNGATSPDGNWVAGVDRTDITIWSWNSDTVKRGAVLQNGWPISAIGWAPDGKRVLFVQSEGNCGIGGASVIGLFNVETNQVKELLRTQDPALLTFRFESIDELTFFGTSPDPHRFRLTEDSLVALQ